MNASAPARPRGDGRENDARDRTGRVTGPFQQPALWRAEIIADFRLRGEERCAAASPVPGFPQLLRSVLSSLDDLPEGVWLDIGGGLGGVSSWLGRTLDVDSIVLDAAPSSLHAARRLFPTLMTVATDAQALPVRSSVAATAIISGTISLLDDLDDVFGEVARVLRPGGAAVVVDLWSSDRDTRRWAPNTFWSVEEATSRALTHGLDPRHVAVAETTTGWWSSAAEQVCDEIDRRHAGDEGYVGWRSDQDHLRAVVASGEVLPAAVVLRRDPVGD